MNIRYRVQKMIGRLFDHPIIPKGKTVGYSFVKSERVGCHFGSHVRVYSPYWMHYVRIGDYSYVSTNSRMARVTIGKFCSIGPNFCCGLGLHPTSGVSTAPMFYSTARQNGMTLCKATKYEESKDTHIGNDVFVGANVTLIDGVSIGDGAIVGAGAVVTKDIPPYAIVVGVPARVIRYRFDERQIESLLQLEWWNRPKQELNRVERHFWDVDAFLEDSKL